MNNLEIVENQLKSALESIIELDDEKNQLVFDYVEYAYSIVKKLNLPDIGNSGSICECREEWYEHIFELNKSKCSTHIEYDKCKKCGRCKNIKEY